MRDNIGGHITDLEIINIDKNMKIIGLQCTIEDILEYKNEVQTNDK